MILKRCNKLCHSSRVKLPFGKMSAGWFLDSTYLIWTFWSKLILSNNQSRATRWVRDTCLIAGLLLLLMNIFLTDSLSSQMCNSDSFSERRAFEGTWSMFDRSTFWSNTCLILGLWIIAPVNRMHAWVVLVICEFPALQWPSPTSRAQVNRPYANQQPMILSLILWSYYILTFASCTSNWYVQMFHFQKCTKLAWC